MMRAFCRAGNETSDKNETLKLKNKSVTLSKQPVNKPIFCQIKVKVKIEIQKELLIQFKNGHIKHVSKQDKPIAKFKINN